MTKKDVKENCGSLLVAENASQSAEMLKNAGGQLDLSFRVIEESWRIIGHGLGIHQ